MKLYSLAILLLLTINLQAQETIPGFYINKQNDTIRVEIRNRKGLFGQTTNNFLKELEVIDSGKISIRYTPTEILGFGFTRKGERHFYVSKPVKDGSFKFLSPIYMGPKSSLYQFGYYQSGGGAVPSQQTFYTFEKADGSFLFLRNILNKKFKDEVKEFYKDSPEVQQLLDTKLKYWLDLNKDLLAILIAANK